MKMEYQRDSLTFARPLKKRSLWTWMPSIGRWPAELWMQTCAGKRRQAKPAEYLSTNRRLSGITRASARVRWPAA